MVNELDDMVSEDTTLDPYNNSVPHRVLPHLRASCLCSPLENLSPLLNEWISFLIVIPECPSYQCKGERGNSLDVASNAPTTTPPTSRLEHKTTLQPPAMSLICNARPYCALKQNAR